MHSLASLPKARRKILLIFLVLVCSFCLPPYLWYGFVVHRRITRTISQSTVRFRQLLLQSSTNTPLQPHTLCVELLAQRLSTTGLSENTSSVGSTGTWVLPNNSDECTWKPVPTAPACGNIHTILGVMTYAAETQRRAIIRRTWKNFPNVYHHHSNPSGTILVLFVVGLPNRTHTPLEQHKQLAQEMVTYRDVLLLNVAENMNSGKTYAWYHTASQLFNACRHLRWIGKGDTDSYVRTVALERAMLAPELHGNGLYWGWMIPCSLCSPSELFLPDNVEDKRLDFDFATGMLQLLTFDLVKWIASDPLPRVWAVGKEDVNVGYWLARGKLEKGLYYRTFHDERFHDWGKENETWWAYKQPSNESIIIHKTYTPAEFMTLTNLYAADSE